MKPDSSTALLFLAPPPPEKIADGFQQAGKKRSAAISQDFVQKRFELRSVIATLRRAQSRLERSRKAAKYKFRN